MKRLPATDHFFYSALQIENERGWSGYHPTYCLLEETGAVQEYTEIRSSTEPNPAFPDQKYLGKGWFHFRSGAICPVPKVN